MTDLSLYPRPVPLSQTDALELFNTIGQWPDVPGTFIVYEMIGLAEREGEWRYAGAARSLVGAFEQLIEFGVAFGAPFGSDRDKARENVASVLRSWMVAALPRLEDGWSTRYEILAKVPAAHRVIICYEAQ